MKLKGLRHPIVHFIIAFVILLSGLHIDFKSYKSPGNWPGFFIYVPIFGVELICACIYLVLRRVSKGVMNYFLDAYMVYTFLVYLVVILGTVFEIRIPVQIPNIPEWELFLFVKGSLVFCFISYLLYKLLDLLSGINIDK